MLIRKSSNHILKYINETPYLISYGQTHSEQGIDHKLNDSGAKMWQLLNNGETVSEAAIVEHVMKHYEVGESERNEIEKSVDAFVHSMLQLGLVEESNESTSKKTEHPLESLDLDLRKDLSSYANSRVYEIAGLNIRISDEINFTDGKLEAFEMQETCNHISQEVVIVAKEEASKVHISSQEYIEKHTLIDTPFFQLIEYQNAYSVIPKDLPSISTTYITKDARKAIIVTNTGESQDIFLALRIPFLYLALLNGAIAIHSASILYDNKAWLFSGPSGTGKSTHTNLWKKLFEISMINGDLNLIKIENGIPIVCGLPWCGTSEIFAKGSWPLGGIVFLKQSQTDRTSEIEESFKHIKVLHRLMSPLWTPELLSMAVSVVEDFVEKVQIFELECTMNDQAAEVCKAKIDNYK